MSGSSTASGTSVSGDSGNRGPTTGGLSGGTEDPERLLLSETDMVHLILEFMSARDLPDSQLGMEKEAGVVNEAIASPDLLFLRSLVIDGRWDDVLEFLQPLEEAFRSFPGKKIRATVLKHRFLDTLASYASSEGSAAPAAVAVTVTGGSTVNDDKRSGVLDELVKVLNELEALCESKEEYSSLCLLLTSPTRLAEHPEYKNWKSSTARIACFKHLKPLVQKFMPPPNGPLNPLKISKNDRLVQLLIKGILYEACVDFCQSRAITSDKKAVMSQGRHTAFANGNSLRFPNLLSDNQLSESDLSLLSWLRSIPSSTFNCPFQRRNLRVDIEPLPKPQKTLMNMSIMDSASDLLSRSMASTSFHLSTAELNQPEITKAMTTSVDRIFSEVAPVDSIHQVVLSHQVNTDCNRQSNYFQNSQNNNNNHASKHPPSSNISSSRAHSMMSYDSVRPSPHLAKEYDKPRGNPTTSKAKFVAVTSLEDVQAVRCAEFHPAGGVYAIGSNSKTLRVCAYPEMSDLTENHVAYQPTVLFKRTKHHKGSIYCLGWSPDGTFLATGSNDKTVKMLKFDDINSSELTGSQEVELSMHDGTVRDVCFIEENNNKTSLLVSGGAGDCKIYVTDCGTATPFQAMSGHTGAILSLYNWGSQIFCSGSQDKSIRFWDLRTRGCVDIITPLTSNVATKSAVTSVCVEPSGRLLISGHEDAAIVLYDIRGQRQIQSMKTHSADVRSVRFSPAAYYLLSGGYDNRIVLTDLQGDLSNPLPSVVVATHQDKVISGRWHPSEFTFISTSADKTVALWALPPEI